eukprot:7121609-Pyramimonas_sp.AAC.1
MYRYTPQVFFTGGGWRVLLYIGSLRRVWSVESTLAVIGTGGPVWVAIYVGSYLCWLPLDYVPVLSDAGKGTLFAYLANQEATFVIMVSRSNTSNMRLARVAVYALSPRTTGSTNSAAPNKLTLCRGQPLHSDVLCFT